MSLERRREWIEPKHGILSIARQCALAGVSGSSYYYEPLGEESEENLALMRVIDRLYLKRPFYGAPRMTDWLRELGYRVKGEKGTFIISCLHQYIMLASPLCHGRRGLQLAAFATT